ncbi:MAG: histidinol-phosphate transaminase [Alphaproteobacteria bacterium]|nr:histidinol-phosphate transaminase [Alphaproteobacteria bacterium]
MSDLADRVAAVSWITPAVRALPPHAAPPTFRDLQRLPGTQRALHLNESPFPPSPRAIEAAAAALRGPLNRYPQSRAPELAAALATRTGVGAGRIVFGVGSDELIHVIAEIALGPGDRCVMPVPSFPRYAVSTRIRGAEVAGVPIDAGGASDAAGLLAAIDARTRVVFACTPNAPSGGMMAAAALERLAREVPADVLLVVDEAYHEYGRHAGGPDALAALAARRGPWIVLRTFSKAHGLAALRVGYALCGSDVEAEALRRVKMTFNVTEVAQAAALASLEDEAHMQASLDATAVERAWLSEGLRRLQLRPCPSFTNFVSVDLGMPAQPAMQALAARGIHVRDWRHPDWTTQLRVAIGTREDNEAVLGALGDVLAEARR